MQEVELSCCVHLKHNESHTAWIMSVYLALSLNMSDGNNQMCERIVEGLLQFAVMFHLSS